MATERLRILKCSKLPNEAEPMKIEADKINRETQSLPSGSRVEPALEVELSHKTKCRTLSR